MDKKYTQISTCPNCGAPLLVSTETWCIGDPLYDAKYDAPYMPGIIYTCRCYRNFLQPIGLQKTDKWVYYYSLDNSQSD